MTALKPTPRVAHENKTTARSSKNLKRQVTENLSEARIYVGTYAKYNEGSIFGKWMDLSDYSGSEEFYKACKELHADEEDPELMFQDYENIPSGLISESWLSPNVFAVIEAVTKLDDTQQEAFTVWCSFTSNDLATKDINDLIESFQDDYQGEYSSEEDYAYQVVEETMEVPEGIKTYFDYEKFARDLFICDYYYDEGYVFRRS